MLPFILTREQYVDITGLDFHDFFLVGAKGVFPGHHDAQSFDFTVWELNSSTGYVAFKIDIGFAGYADVFKCTHDYLLDITSGSVESFTPVVRIHVFNFHAFSRRGRMNKLPVADVDAYMSGIALDVVEKQVAGL